MAIRSIGEAIGNMMKHCGVFAEPAVKSGVVFLGRHKCS